MTPGSRNILRQATLLLSKSCCLMPETMGRAVASATGHAFWQLWVPERRRLINIIDRVYHRLGRTPPAPVPVIVRRNFIHFALAIYEFLRSPLLSARDLSQRFEFVNEQNLTLAQQEGRGVIFALPHIGNWEIFGAAIAHAGYPVNSFFLSQKEDELGRLLDNLRSYSGIKLHERDRGAIKALRALKNGEQLGMIADQDGGNNGVYLDFLGHWVSMPSGPAAWSLKTGAVLMPIYSLRQGMSANYRGYFMPPMTDEKPGTYEEQVVTRTRRLTDWMQELILRYPDQYLWFYDRFKPRHESWVTTQKKIFGQVRHGEERYGQR